MDQAVWIAWLVLGVMFVVAEVFTLGFVLLWFGIGAFAAAAAGVAGFGFVAQFLIFAAVSIGLTAMSRTIFAKYLSHRDEDTVKTGVDALPGKIGTVTTASKGSLQESAVKVFGSTWTAFPADGETEFAEGEKVEVVKVRGSSILVRRVNREMLGWREDPNDDL